jgi:hypothetical protein
LGTECPNHQSPKGIEGKAGILRVRFFLIFLPVLSFFRGFQLSRRAHAHRSGGGWVLMLEPGGSRDPTLSERRTDRQRILVMPSLLLIAAGRYRLSFNDVEELSKKNVARVRKPRGRWMAKQPEPPFRNTLENARTSPPRGFFVSKS